MASSSSTPSQFDMDRYVRAGVTGPVKVFNAADCRSIVSHFERENRPAPAEWWKGHAVTDKFVSNIARRSEVTNHVRALLGSDVVLWGAQYLQRTPGQVHAWHSDVETILSPDQFVSVWIGLANTSKSSGLEFVAGTHSVGKSIQQVASERGLSRDGLTGEEVLALARELSSDTFIESPDARDGDAVFFTGGIWHASLNTTNETRAALLLQYSTPRVSVLIPDYRQLDWPFGVTGKHAPSILIAGSASASRGDVRSAPD